MPRNRQRLQELARQYASLVGKLLGRGPLARGTVNWHEQAGGRYPGLTRGEGGTVVGWRIRLEHMAWLGPLLKRHKAYRQAGDALLAAHAGDEGDAVAHASGAEPVAGTGDPVPLRSKGFLRIIRLVIK